MEKANDSLRRGEEAEFCAGNNIMAATQLWGEGGGGAPKKDVLRNPIQEEPGPSYVKKGGGYSGIFVSLSDPYVDPLQGYGLERWGYGGLP